MPVAFTATNLATGQPTLGVPTLDAPPPVALIPTGLNVSAPLLGTPSAQPMIYITLEAINLSAGSPIMGAIPAIVELNSPLAWLRNRLKRWSRDPTAPYYDEDDTENEGPVQEAIYSNLNDDIELTVSQLTLIGRTSPGRGPAEPIEAAPPLYMFDGKLLIDITDLMALRTDFERLLQLIKTFIPHDLVVSSPTLGKPVMTRL